MKVITQIISLMLAFSLASEGNHIEQITVPLSNPAGPGTLVVNHHKGSVNVTGYVGDSVVVRASARYRTDESSSEGCDIYLGAVENNNNVVINVEPRYRTIDLDILVPQEFSVRLRNDDSGTISVEHLSGEIEVSNQNGDIVLTEISGSAVLDTVDGDITVRFDDIKSGVPMAFSTVEGNIDVYFPDNLNALIKVRSDYGIIRNEYAPVPTAGERETIPSASTDFEAGRWNYCKINSGGPEIRLMSFLGNIDIKRSENRPN